MYASTEHIVFVVATKSEAARIRELDCAAISTDETDVAQELSRASQYLRQQPSDPIARFHAMGNMAQYVAMLDDAAANDFADACEVFGVPYKNIPASQVKAADESGTFDELVTSKRDSMAQSLRANRIKAEWAYLRQFQVDDTANTAYAIGQGEIVFEPVPTGMAGIDKVLGGGLPIGVTTLGAISSMGKTSLTVQIASEIARSGRPVVFVTLEQSAAELVTMTVNRIDGMRGYDYALRKPIPWWTSKDKSTEAYINRQLIMRGPTKWAPDAAERIQAAILDYSMNIAPNFYVMAPERQPTVDDVMNVVRTIGGIRGEIPVVFVDYLQLLAPKNERWDERRTTQDNITSLRCMARDLHTAVVVISALNRKSIGEGVTMEAFRESSGIEYGSDAMLGMQPRGMYDKLKGTSETSKTSEARGLTDEVKGQDAKELEIRVLKNRNNPTPDARIPVVFDGRCSYFYDDTSAQADEAAKSEPEQTSLDQQVVGLNF